MKAQHQLFKLLTVSITVAITGVSSASVSNASSTKAITIQQSNLEQHLAQIENQVRMNGVFLSQEHTLSVGQDRDNQIKTSSKGDDKPKDPGGCPPNKPDC